jgi:Carboxypeptidase regulatory-like domain
VKRDPVFGSTGKKFQQTEPLWEANTMKFKQTALLLTVMLWVLCAGAVFGQSTNSGDISGIVSDGTGAAIPGATVTVLDIATGVSKDYTTNQDGVYDTSSIVAGNYKITFSRDGFSKLVRTSITVIVGNTTVNATLKVGAVTDSVVVNTDIPLLRTENGEQSTTLSSQALTELPQVGQRGPDWSSFVILLPGAAGAPMGAQGTTGGGSVAGGATLAVNGNLPFSTVLADGATTTLPASANSDINIQETVQEVQIVTSNFSAQYGIGGALFNQISKGGGDSFHGSAYEYWQNDALNADNYNFTSGPSSKSFLRFNNYGGSIGGPILKRKLFFFFDYDKIKDNGGNPTTAYTIPTQAVIGGDFTGYPTLYDPATTAIIPTGTHTYSDGTTQTCPCVTRQSFADEYGNGNKIPTNRIDPVAAALQAYFPGGASSKAIGTIGTGSVQANGLTVNNYTYTSTASNPFTRYFGRLDYQINSNNRLTISDTEGDNPGISYGAGICPINCRTGDVSRNNAQVTDVWTITPHLTNELRLGYTNQLNFFVPATLGKGYPADLGWQFAKADNFPSINISGGYDNNAPNGNAIISSDINAVYKEHAYDPSDVVTLVLGKHILHFGGEFLIYQNNSTAWGNTNAGTMNYTGVYTSQYVGSSSTGFSYADFLLGQTNQWSAKVTPEYGGRMKVPQVFVQDDYKLRPNLTLNFGLRYQIQTGWSEINGNEASFDPTVENPATATLGAMWYGSTHANGRTRIQNGVYDTFLPRVGFSYMLDPNTTIRGGFGLYAYNWSNDTYNGNVMGGAFGSQGQVTDNTLGITPVVLLSGSGSSLPYTAASTDPAAFNGQGVNYIAYHQPVGGSYQWNLQVQRELSTDMVASLAYVASYGHDLPFPVDINEVPEDKLAQNDQQFRPYPQFGSISANGAIPNQEAKSNYNSLQATIEKRFSHGLNFNFDYVWSHFLDDMDSSGWGSHGGNETWQNAFNPSANYGNSNFDIRNAFKGSALYQLPVGKGRQFLNNNTLLDEAIGGWQVSGTLILQSGQPFTAQMANGGNSYSQAGSNFEWYPNVIGDPKLQGRGPARWFNEAAFAVPASGTFGDERRNQLTGPAFSLVNLSLGKTFAIWEQVKFQVRADANNAFNHPNFGIPTQNLSVNPDNSITTGTSNITTLANTNRTIQLSGRLTF